jgi:hypothetical protein
MNTHPTRPTPEALATLRALTTPSQFAAVAAALRGEEAAHFAEVINRLHATWQAMPTTYATEAQGRAAVAHLHYFLGGADWWIVEKDADPDNVGQVQAFGLADLGMGPELGYISIPELLEVGAELDFYYTPKTVAEILGRCVA